MPERIDELMKCTSFLEGEENIADICVQRVVTCAQSYRIFKKESCVLSSCNVNEEERSKTGEKGSHDRKSRKNSRGLQRPHLHHKMRAKKKSVRGGEDRKEESRKRVVVELSEKHIDTRALHGPMNICIREDRLVRKSLPKSKSWKNGKCSEWKGYSAVEIKRETESALFDLINSDEFWLQNSGEEEEGEVECFVEQESQCYNQEFESWSLSTKNRRTKRGKTESSNRIVEEKLQFVNTASSQTTVKYPKGSFQFIDPPHIGSKPPEDISADDDFVHVSVQDVNEVDDSYLPVDDTQEAKSNDVYISSPTPQMLNVLDTKDRFEMVDLVFDELNQKELTQESKLNGNHCDFKVRNCPVIFGRCWPPIFEVKLHRELGGHTESTSWSLLGAASTIALNDTDLTWEVTLKNAKASTREDDKVKESFFSHIDSVTGNETSLDYLVDVALTSLPSVTGMVKDNAGVNKFTAGNDTDTNSLSVSNSESVSGCQGCRILSMQGALARLDGLDTNTLEQSHDAVREDTRTQHVAKMKETFDTISECGVCFNSFDQYGFNTSGLIKLLPCQHLFCYKCWQSHILFTFLSGKCDIKCMGNDCSELLGETELHVLMPEEFISKFTLRRQERRVEKSPLCKWCPETKCGRVAMIERLEPGVNQFGYTVECDCRRSWCFTCQTDAHWPASCCQMATYRKILSKVGDDLLVNSVTVNVHLKPCPKCKYPIEKNEGCPHMTCVMCSYDFCWKCLENAWTHSVYRCTAGEDDNFEMYNLRNECVSNFPLKFIKECIGLRKKCAGMKTSGKSLKCWLGRLSRVHTGNRYRLPFVNSAKGENIENNRNEAIGLAHACVSFLSEVYNFLEVFNLLLSFASLNDSLEDKQTRFSHLHRVSNKLEIVADRLEEIILNKNLYRIMKVFKQGLFFLSSGHTLMGMLKDNVDTLQRLSKDVPTEPYGDLDVREYIQIV